MSAAAREIVAQVIASGGELWFDGDRIRGRNIPRPLAEQIKALPVGVALVALLSTTKAASVDPGGSTPQQRAPATVHCRDCAEFDSGPTHWAGGLGKCARTADGRPPVASRGIGVCFPDAPRQCPDYKETQS
jgi:hypothetical protein